MFQKIEKLSDLLPHIENSKQIRVKVDESTGFSIVCYMVQDEDTFEEGNMDFTQECRGITFDQDGNIASRTLGKFFNVGERESTRPENIDWSQVDRIMDKRDGCLDGETEILTNIGFFTIKEICEKDFKGKVHAFDHNTNRQVFTPVIATSVKPNNNTWFKLTLENGKTIKLTANHKVWCNNRKDYVRADELTDEDDVEFIKY